MASMKYIECAARDIAPILGEAVQAQSVLSLADLDGWHACEPPVAARLIQL